MCLNIKKVKGKKNRGSALVIAIFVIIVMTLLGTALVRMLSSSAESIVYEVLGTRAFQAAQIGAQWQLQQIFPVIGAVQLCSNATPPVLSTIEGLESCEISALVCTSEEIESVRYYEITSTGQCDVAGVLTSRTVQVQARNL